MAAIWALVADESRARVFARLEANLPLQDIDDILPGNDEGGKRKNGNGESTDRSPDAFARKLANYLSSARKLGQYDQFYLVAPEEFRDRVESELDSSTRRTLRQSFDENLAVLKLAEIRDRLSSLIR